MAQHAFWIIVDGQTPTSFRSRQKDDLLPTLTQLKRTQPQVVLLWFERGRLWQSPEEARAALLVRRKAPMGRPRDWRPGGDHKDPRAKYAISRDQKRARFKARLGHDRRDDSTPPGENAAPPARPPFRPDRPDRPPYPSARPDRPPHRSARPPTSPDRPHSGRSPADRPFGDRFRKPGPRPVGRDRDRSSSAPPAPRSRETQDKPKGFGDRPWRPKKPWQPGKPWRPPKPKSGKG